MPNGIEQPGFVRPADGDTLHVVELQAWLTEPSGDVVAHAHDERIVHRACSRRLSRSARSVLRTRPSKPVRRASPSSHRARYSAATSSDNDAGPGTDSNASNAAASALGVSAPASCA